jgi:hypothetical protein
MPSMPAMEAIMRPEHPTHTGKRRRKARRWTRSAIGCAAEALERRAMLSSVIPINGEFRVNTYTTSDQWYPAVAMDADGDFVATWESRGQDGYLYGIYAQRYNAAGVGQGTEFQVNTYTTLNQRRPAVAMNSDGDFIIVWESLRQDGNGYGVYCQRYNAAGLPQGVEFRANTYTPAGQGRACVAMDANGNFVIAWDSDGGFSGSGVYAQRYSATGDPQGAEFRVNTQTITEQTSPMIAMDSDGNFVITWSGLDGSSRGIRAQRYNSDGAALGGEFLVNTHTTGPQSFSSVAMDADGDFVVAWRSAGQETPFSIFAQRFRADGAAQGSEFRVNTSDGFQASPSAAMDYDGNFVIAWQGYPQDQSGYGIYAQRYNSTGNAQGGEFRVNSYTPNDQKDVAIAMDAAGDSVVTWQSGLQDGSGFGIFAQRYAVVPEVTSSAFLFESSPHRLRFRFNHDVRDRLGTDDLALQNLTTGESIPSNQFALLYDPTSDVATFLYLGPGSDSIGGVLPDGRYRATLLADGIITPQGASPPADHRFEFFFLNGDSNRDGQVNLSDFDILASNFGQKGTDFPHGDFTYDGTTDLEDFDVLASRFGAALPPTLRPGVGSLSASDFDVDEQDTLVLLLR